MMSDPRHAMVFECSESEGVMTEDTDCFFVGRCPRCDGEGIIEVEVAMPHNFNRDVGYLDVRRERCLDCDGSGEVDPGEGL